MGTNLEGRDAVTGPEMDRNRLAALLDARLAERDREDALAHLSASDEDGEVFADAAAVLRELEAEDGIVAVDDAADEEPPRVPPAEPGNGATVIPLRPPSTRRAWRRPPARWLALAAVLAGVLLVLPPWRWGRAPAGPGEFAALLASREAGLPDGWTEQTPPWGVTRGGSDAMIDNARAARLGALHTQLELAVAGRQADETADLARRMVQMLGDVTAGGTVSPTYEQIVQRAGQPPESLAELLNDGRENVAGLAGEDYFALGAWAEAARIAARQQDAAFFRARESRRMLDRAASLPSLDEETRVSVDALRAAGQPDAQPAWTAVEGHATQLLGYLGGRAGF